MTVAELLADAIATDCADRVFVFPGSGSNLDVIDALRARGITIVLARSEGGASLMAGVYADLTGRPVAVLVGLGPGVASVVNGCAQARLDQSPLLIVSDRFTDAELDTTAHQALDHAALLAPVTKWQATLDPETAAATVAHAVATAAEHPRGPVHLSLPRDVARREAAPAGEAAAAHGTAAPPDAAAPREAAAAHGMAAPPDAAAPREAAVRPAELAALDLSPAADLLARARRPLLLVGDEANDVPQTDLVALAERLGGPVLTSYKAKGTFPEDHPQWCGIVTNAALEAGVLAAADAIVAAGLDPVELLPRPWPHVAPIALRAHGETAPGYRPALLLVGDVARLVNDLAARLDPHAAWGEPAERRQALLDALRIPADGSLSALEVVEAAQAVAPPDTTVVVDAGAHMFAVTWGWRATLPRHFLISNGLATMGYAVPAALAAALARPGEPVLAFTGDGGLMLHGAELETAVRNRARLVVLVINDSSLSLIRIKQEDIAYGRAAVDFGPVDAAAYARSLGAHAATARTADEVADALTRAFAHDGPNVVEVRTSGSEYRALQHVIRSTGAPVAVTP